MSRKPPDSTGGSFGLGFRNADLELVGSAGGTVAPSDGTGQLAPTLLTGLFVAFVSSRLFQHTVHLESPLEPAQQALK